jgi:4-hydroxythreonine-4-phosphate dehydrogenase
MRTFSVKLPPVKCLLVFRCSNRGRNFLIAFFGESFLQPSQHAQRVSVPHLVITLGDPWSVNVEAVATLLSQNDSRSGMQVTLVGSREVWNAQTRLLLQNKLLLAAPAVNGVTSWSECRPDAINFLDIGMSPMKPASELSQRERGSIATAALLRLQDLPHGERTAVLTCPIDKKDCVATGFGWHGQTEYFSHLWQGEAVMVLAGPKLRVGLATNHLALRDVPGAMTQQVIQGKLKQLCTTLQEIWGLSRPRIGVCALNPHAGDGGLFGQEDDLIIRPAIEASQQLLPHAEITGPWPADTVFWRASQGSFDAVLAMYHDQGLGPIKTLHFDTAVNISGGLSSLRVSPDHGPARDLFLTGKLSTRSFAAALSTCRSWLMRRKESQP